jgi:hypothetical protein
MNNIEKVNIVMQSLIIPKENRAFLHLFFAADLSVVYM